MKKRIDVYKRQVKDCFEMKKYLESHGIVCPEPKESGMGGFNIMNVTGPDGEILEFLDRPSSVSYTHLDVYKRQTLYCHLGMDGECGGRDYPSGDPIGKKDFAGPWQRQHLR